MTTGERPAWADTLLDPVCWRDGLLAWLAQRAGLALLYGLGAVVFGRPGHAPPGSLPYSVSTSPWLNWWDSGHFADIARAGYTTPDQSVFYPLYPLTERLLAPLTGGSFVVAGFVVANVAALGAFVAFRMLARAECEPGTARVAVLLFAFNPVAVYMATTYSESLFFLCALVALLALRHRRWIAAALGAALAVLTRQVGLLLLLPALIEAARLRAPRQVAPALVAVALPLLALAAFGVYLDHAFHSATLLLDAERRYYNRYLDWPWTGPAQAFGVLVAGRDGDSWNAAYDLGVTALMGVAVLLTAFSRLALSLRAYAVVGFLGLVSLPMHGYYIGEDLNGLPRYLMVLAPAWLGVALWTESRRGLRIAAVAICLLSFGITGLYFGHPPLLL